MDTETSKWIAALDDTAAVQALTVLMRAPRDKPPGAAEPNRELADALSAEWQRPRGGDGPPPTDGDAARAALLLLADDPRYAEPVRRLAAGPLPERFDLGVTGGVLLLSGLLLALQTRVHIKRDKEGRVTIEVEKKAADIKLLAPLVRRIVALIKG